MALINIALSRIPGLKPVVSFSDKIDVEYHDIYPVLEPKIPVLTPKQFATSENPLNFRNQKIQTQYYESFTLTITVNQSINTNLLILAENITITDRDTTTYQLRELESYDIVDVADSRFKKVIIVFNIEGDFLESVVNYLDKKHIRTTESGYLADSALNRLILTVNPDWYIAAFEVGTNAFGSGFDFAANDKDFNVTVRFFDGSSNTRGFTLDQTTTDLTTVVAEVNSKIGATAFAAWIEAYDAGFVGIRSIAGIVKSIELIAGSDDFLALAGLTAGTYTATSSLDDNFAAQGDTLTFYTKLNPYFPIETQESESENVDGINIPVYDNTFRFLEIDFILDDNIKIYGTFTDFQAFMYYVGRTWYKDSSGDPKGEKITLYTATEYEGLEVVSIEKIENDSLVNMEIVRLKMVINQLQNFRFK